MRIERENGQPERRGTPPSWVVAAGVLHLRRTLIPPGSRGPETRWGTLLAVVY